MEDSCGHVQLQQHHVMSQQQLSTSLTTPALHTHTHLSATRTQAKSTTHIQTSATRGKPSPQSTKKSSDPHTQQPINVFSVSKTRKQKKRQRKKQKQSDNFSIGSEPVNDVEQLAGFLRARVSHEKYEWEGEGWCEGGW